MAMEYNNEDVNQINDIEEGDDEMHEDRETTEDQGNWVGEKYDDGQAVAYKRKPRTKKSTVWDEMKEITTDNGTKKVQCNHCKELFAKSSTGTTTQYNRHLKNYLQRRMKLGEQNRQKQHVLSLTKTTVDVDTVQMLLCANDWVRTLHGLKKPSRGQMEADDTTEFEEIEIPDS